MNRGVNASTKIVSNGKWYLKDTIKLKHLAETSEGLIYSDTSPFGYTLPLFKSEPQEESQTLIKYHSRLALEPPQGYHFELLATPELFSLGVTLPSPLPYVDPESEEVCVYLNVDESEEAPEKLYYVLLVLRKDVNVNVSSVNTRVKKEKPISKTKTSTKKSKSLYKKSLE